MIQAHVQIKISPLSSWLDSGLSWPWITLNLCWWGYLTWFLLLLFRVFCISLCV